MSMDEIRSTLFSAGLRRLLIRTLQPGERVLWQGQPDAVADMMMWRFRDILERARGGNAQVNQRKPVKARRKAVQNS